MDPNANGPSSGHGHGPGVQVHEYPSQQQQQHNVSVSVSAPGLGMSSPLSESNAASHSSSHPPSSGHVFAPTPQYLPPVAHHPPTTTAAATPVTPVLDPTAVVSAASSSVLQAWGNVPIAAASLSSAQVSSLFAQRPGNLAASLEWPPSAADPNQSAALLQRVDHFQAIAHSVYAALQSVPNISLKPIPHTTPSAPTIGPGTTHTPLSDALLHHLPSRATSMPPQLRSTGRLPLLPVDPNVRSQIVAELTPKQTQRLSLAGPSAPTSQSSSAASTPRPNMIRIRPAAAGSASASAPSSIPAPQQTKKRKMAEAMIVDDPPPPPSSDLSSVTSSPHTSLPSSSQSQPRQRSVIEIHVPVRPPAKKIKVKPPTAAAASTSQDDLAVYLATLAGTAQPSTPTKTPRALLTRLMDKLVAGSFALSEPDARKLVAACLPHVSAVHTRTYLRPRSASAAHSNEDADDEDDSPEAQAAKLVRVASLAEAATEASHIILILYLAHPGIVVAEHALLVADTFKNHVQESVLPVLEALDLEFDSAVASTKATKKGVKSAKGKAAAAAAAAATAASDLTLSASGLPTIPLSILHADQALETKTKALMYLQCALMPRMLAFVQAHARQQAFEQFAVAASYGAMSALFAGSAADKTMQQRAMELVTGVASGMPTLRVGILDDIVGNLIRSSSAAAASGVGAAGKRRAESKRLRLQDGTCIQFATALVLHLIQALVPTDSPATTAAAAATQSSSMAPLDECRALAIHVVSYLLTRATKKSKSKSAITNEAEYLTLLRSVFADVVAVLPSPEFPAAELMARVTLQLMIGVMEDDKVTDPGIKSLAMDVFSSLLCHTRRISAQYAQMGEDEVDRAKQVVGAYLELHAKHEATLVAAWAYYCAEWDVAEARKKRAKEEADAQAAATASSSSSQGQGQSQSRGHKHVVLSDSEEEQEDDDDDEVRMDVTSDAPAKAKKKQKHAASSIDATTLTRADIMTHLRILLARASSLPRHTEPILARIVKWFGAKEANVRSRAVKVLSNVAQVDPALMDLPYIQSAIKARLSDQSPSVRDSVLDVVGKWIVASAEAGTQIGSAMLGIILDRVLDTATSVRKRAIKTAGLLAPHVGGVEQVDIAVRVFLRIRDEEDTVSELAKKTFMDMVLPPNPGAPSSAASDDGMDVDDGEGAEGARAATSAARAFKSLSAAARLKALSQATVFCGVIARAPQDACVQFLRKDMATKLGVLPPALLHQVESSDPLSPALFDALLALSTIARAVPQAITANVLTHCAQLLPSTPQQMQRATDEANAQASLVLALFRDAMFASDPGLSPAAAAGLVSAVPLPNKMLEELEVNALRTVQYGAQMLLADAVAVACLAARRLDRPMQIAKLLASVTQHLSKTRAALGKDGSGQVPENIKEVHIRRFLVILGSIAQFGGLLHVGHAPEPAFALLLFYCLPSCGLSELTRAQAIETVGRMALQYGKLLLQPGMIQLIKDALAGCTEEPRVAESALKLIVQFMAQEDARAAEKFMAADAEDFDRQAFLGTTMEFANAGIAESIAQSCVQDLVTCSLVAPTDFTRPFIDLAQEAIGFIALNRLAHPKLVMPAVVALESSPLPHLATIARSHHRKLHSQHHSTIYDANRDSVIAAFEYQSRVQNTPAPVGFAADADRAAATGNAAEVSAHLLPFYAIIRESKRDRRPFLNMLVRFFEYKVHPDRGGGAEGGAGTASNRRRVVNAAENAHAPEPVDVCRCKWLADNIATLEYRHEDELLTVLQLSNRVVSSLGLAIKVDLEQALRSAAKDASAAAASAAAVASDDSAAHDLAVSETGWPTDALVRGAACLAFLIAAKTHLVHSHNITLAKIRSFKEGATGAGGRAVAARATHRRDDTGVFTCPLSDEDLVALTSKDTQVVEDLAPDMLQTLERMLEDDPALFHEETEEVTTDAQESGTEMPDSHDSAVGAPDSSAAARSPAKTGRLAAAMRSGAAGGTRSRNKR